MFFVCLFVCMLGIVESSEIILDNNTIISICYFND